MRRSRFVAPASERKETLAVGFPGAQEPADCAQAGGALAVALGALEPVGPFSFAPVRVGASIVPSDIPFDISAFLPVPPQNFGTDGQFQLPPVHTVFLTATRRQNFLIPAPPPRLPLTELA